MYECNGVAELVKLIDPAQMNHGEAAMVTVATKLLTILHENGKCHISTIESAHAIDSNLFLR